MVICRGGNPGRVHPLLLCVCSLLACPYGLALLASTGIAVCHLGPVGLWDGGSQSCCIYLVVGVCAPGLHGIACSPCLPLLLQSLGVEAVGTWFYRPCCACPSYGSWRCLWVSHSPCGWSYYSPSLALSCIRHVWAIWCGYARWAYRPGGRY